MKPKSDITDPPQRPARASFHRITDRQVEIMTTTLCDVIASDKLPPDDTQQAIAVLIGAMVKQVTRLNQAVAVANDPSDLGVKMTINNAGRPVELHADAGLIPRSVVEAELDAEADRIRAFGRLAR
ncbi:hypothetical protein [Burkholderia aenigmatica]|uniref:hypothetical protein n=1 Tax=Burkholderia aenigmatica TaxID=2015348 RepID=UPI00158147CD|nr:hypothetical protein [Burkholderia aenigmatica]